ncbi:MAG: aminotransferase class IV [Rhodobacteraceae bacterium]|nr:aminotransferase class IV [Paracoccaceae bacterium]
MESAFRRPLPAGFRLIETFGWRPELGYVNLPAHLARLEATARRFGAPVDRAAILRTIDAVARGDAPLRLRLTLGLDGRPEATAAPFEPGPPVWTVALADVLLDPDDPWLRVKTTERALYDAARAALPPGVHETLFLNRRGEVCEGAISSVFLQSNGVYLTPRLSSGLLPGVLRETLLRGGQAREAVLRVGDLARGRLYLGNSLRGLCAARLA